MEAIILAGGKGTRLQPRVSDVPKPLAPVQERPFLEYVLAYWADQGIKHFVISTGHLAAKISEHFGSEYRGVQLSYSFEKTPLGTGGGALLALSQLRSKGTALLLNGDSFLELTLADMYAFHCEKNSSFTLALSHVLKNDRYGGVDTDKTGRCTKMGSPSLDINGGVYLFEPGFLQRFVLQLSQPLSLERDLLPSWITAGEKVFGWKANGRFIDIGTPDDYARAQDFFK